MKIYVSEPDFLKNNFCSKNEENGPKKKKKRFFEFIEKFGHFSGCGLLSKFILFVVFLHKSYI